MRKTASFIFATSILALTSGAVLAADPSPTVPTNTTNTQNNSYSDKSNTAPGSNASMSTPGGVTATTDDDKSLQKAKNKPKKEKVATHSVPPVKTDTSINSVPNATNGAAANSLTGKSGGQ